MSNKKDKNVAVPRKTLQMPEDRYDETNANKKAEQSAMQTDGCYQKGDRREEPQD